MGKSRRRDLRNPKSDADSTSTSTTTASISTSQTPSTSRASSVISSTPSQPRTQTGQPESKAQAVTEGVKQMAIDARFKDFPKAPAPGKLGSPRQVRVNMFYIKFTDEEIVVNHYDIKIYRKKPARDKEEGKSPKKAKSPPPPLPPSEQGTVRGDQPPTDSNLAELKNGQVLKTIFVMFEEALSVEGGPFHGLKWAFDGKNMFTYGNSIPPEVFVNHIFEVCRDFKFETVVDTFILRITETDHSSNIVQTGIMEDAKQALEIGMSYEASKDMMIRGKGGRGGLFPDEKGWHERIQSRDWTSNLNLHTGIRKAVKVTEEGLVANIDRAAAVFQAAGETADGHLADCPLIDVMKRILKMRPGPDPGFPLRYDSRWASQLTSQLKGFRVTVKYGHPITYDRKHTIAEITSLSVQEITFSKEDGTSISVYDYYRKERTPKVNLKYKNLPCIQLQRNPGSNKTVYIPIEVCTFLKGQYYDKKLDMKVQGVVTQATAVPPHQRMNTIMDGARMIDASARDTLGISLDLNPIQVTARVIDPPTMASGATQPAIEPSNPRANPCDFDVTQLARPVKLERWIIVVISGHRNPQQNADNVIDDFVKKIQGKGTRMSMKIEKPRRLGQAGYARFVNFNEHNLAKLQSDLESIAKDNQGLQMMFIFMASSEVLYHSIKFFGNENSVLTSCIQLDVGDQRDMDTGNNRSKAYRMIQQTFLKNLIFKINAKLGGENFRLEPAAFVKNVSGVRTARPVNNFLKKEHLMVMGLDITHPGKGDSERNLPHSIAGFVASYTSDFTRYVCQARSQQTARQEVIEESIRTVSEESEKFFNLYHRYNKVYPKNLVVFRDGVSEGQFRHVRDNEVTQILSAMKKLRMNCNLIFIAVQKRHNTRMFIEIKDPNGRVVGYENPLPGTVIDHYIVHPERFECYLNSHHALKGTAKPAHYCVLYDDTQNGITCDEMEAMSYYLCYVYARCSKPISIPAPVMYAHLVAEKSAGFVKTKQRILLQQSQGRCRLREEEIDETARVKDFQNKTLFYA